MENEERSDQIWEMFGMEPGLFETIYQLLLVGIREAVNGSMVVTEPPTKNILNEMRMTVSEIEPDLNGQDNVTMRRLGRPGRTMSSLMQGNGPTREMDQEYLEEILVGLGKKLNP